MKWVLIPVSIAAWICLAVWLFTGFGWEIGAAISAMLAGFAWWLGLPEKADKEGNGAPDV